MNRSHSELFSDNYVISTTEFRRVSFLSTSADPSADSEIDISNKLPPATSLRVVLSLVNALFIEKNMEVEW